MGSLPEFLTFLLHPTPTPLNPSEHPGIQDYSAGKELELVLDKVALQSLSLEGRVRVTVTEMLGCRVLAEVTLELTFLITVVTDSGSGGTRCLTFLLTLRWALSLPLRQGGTGKRAVSQEYTWGKRKTQEVTQSLQRRQVAGVCRTDPGRVG